MAFVIRLTPAQLILWNTDAQWKAGFLAGAEGGLAANFEVSTVQVEDDAGVVLMSFVRENKWRVV